MANTTKAVRMSLQLLPKQIGSKCSPFLGAERGHTVVVDDTGSGATVGVGQAGEAGLERGRFGARPAWIGVAGSPPALVPRYTR